MGLNPLKELNKFGQSVWHDYIRRAEILSGDLQRRIDEDGVSGVTSNPSTFEKTIAGSKDYDAAMSGLAKAGKEAPEIFESLAVEDTQSAADLFRPLYDSSGGRDGFVSLEVSPTLARDSAGTVAEARRLHQEVNRPNFLVKVPATLEGLPAIEQLLGEGININITLLFAVDRYEQVANAYLAALEKRAREGKPIDRVASVASVFVSRIDTLADQQLEARLRDAKTLAEHHKIAGLLGKVAISSAKVIYQKFKEIFSSPRFQALAQKGARVQRPLWASTGAKNPRYSDVLYVETLIGPDTINTMPTATLAAFRDHGKARATLEEGLEEARHVLAQLAEVGIDLGAITTKLEDQGVEAFARDHQKLLEVIAEKQKKVLAAAVPKPSVPAVGGLHLKVDAALERLAEEKFSRRLWDRDPSLWKADATHQKIIRNALGWLSVSHSMLEHLDAVLSFVQEAKRAGFKDAVLLGMGGSSLCPDVCRATFGTAPGYLDLHVLDSTVPANISQVEKAIDVGTTLFLVSSKSGGTTETLSFYKYFYDRVRSLKGEEAGENFVAITDPGTALEKLALEKKFRRVFHGHVDIGGRYSALSNFGMAPAALAGVDVRALLDRAERMMHACGVAVPAQDNPGIILGASLAEAARMGRDKITFLISSGIGTFADWVEQLIAESTGKEGKGLVPVAREPLGDPAVYGNDRLFVYLKPGKASDSRLESKVQGLEKAGHPVIRFGLQDKLDLGQEFFRWEVATATASALMGIDAFDQPNVQESKDNTNRLLAQFCSEGKLPEDVAVVESEGLKLYCDAATRAALEKIRQQQGKPANSPEAYLAAFLSQARASDYLALMAYLERTDEGEVLLQSIRTLLRNTLRLATTLGYGPRFLHSTGQLHKGGPNKGLFIQITADDAADLPIPGEAYSFSVLKQAQALGDLGSLQSKGRRVLRFHIGKDIRKGLGVLLKVAERAVQ
jgi:transaldolase/glucose-6-phosphate isomerase